MPCKFRYGSPLRCLHCSQCTQNLRPRAAALRDDRGCAQGCERAVVQKLGAILREASARNMVAKSPTAHTTPVAVCPRGRTRSTGVRHTGSSQARPLRSLAGSHRTRQARCRRSASSSQGSRRASDGVGRIHMDNAQLPRISMSCSYARGGPRLLSSTGTRSFPDLERSA